MRITRGALGALAGLVFHLTVSGQSAACDRASSPLEDPAVATAVAEVVAIVQIKGLAGGVATALVDTLLKGSGKPGDTIAIRGVFSAAEAGKGDLCGSAIGEVGKKYIVMLFGPLPGARQYQLVEPVTSVKPYDAAAQTAIEKALARQHPHSAWLAGKPEVQAQLVLDPGAAPGQVSVFVLVRNVGKSALTYTRQYWPLATQSKCTLRITDAAKSPVAAKDVPIAKGDIAAYFAKNSGTYSAKIEPGDTKLLLLPRVTTAASGWGYKEELGFQYYPVTAHGPHWLAADCVNFFGPGSQLATAALRLDL